MEIISMEVISLAGLLSNQAMGMYYRGFGYAYGYLSYLIFMLPALLLGLWAQAQVKHTFNKYSKIHNSRNMTGAQIARMILDQNGLRHIRVEQVSGQLTDHYDPKKGVIRLSSPVYHSSSIGAIGVAAHEAGHAVQDAEEYAPIRVRNAIVPVCNFGSTVGPILIVIGCLFSHRSFGVNLMILGIALFSLIAVFQLVTLPVELDASSRALNVIKNCGMFAEGDVKGARKVLKAAAMTYVAALITSIMQVLYYVVRILGAGRRND